MTIPTALRNDAPRLSYPRPPKLPPEGGGS